MARTIPNYPVPAYAGDWVLTYVRSNPKTKPGSKSWCAYELFVEGETVKDFAEKHGKGFRSEIAWCVARGYIELSPPEATEEEAEELTEEETEEAAEELADAE